MDHRVKHEVLDSDIEWVTSICQYSKRYRKALLALVELLGWSAREIDDDIIWDEFYAIGGGVEPATLAEAMLASFTLSNEFQRKP